MWKAWGILGKNTEMWETQGTVRKKPELWGGRELGKKWGNCERGQNIIREQRIVRENGELWKRWGIIGEMELWERRIVQGMRNCESSENKSNTVNVSNCRFGKETNFTRTSHKFCL